jgi:hypothetical protein
MSSNQVWNRIGHVPKNFLLILTPGINFVLEGPPFTPPENQFHDSHQESIFQTKSLSVVLSYTHPIAVAYIPMTLLYFLTKCIPVTCQNIFAFKKFLIYINLTLNGSLVVYRTVIWKIFGVEFVRKNN